MIDSGRLLTLLNQTDLIQTRKTALYQFLKELLNNTKELSNSVTNITDSAGTGGIGNVTGPGISVDNQIVLFDGVTGKLIKGASGSGVVHAASGVYSASPVIESDQSLSNVTTQNVTTARHGYVPILPNDATKFFDGTGNYSVPPTNTDYVVASDGGTPPEPINDGAGNFIYVAYTP